MSMATRQERIDAQIKHLEQVQRETPVVDLTEMAAGMKRNVNFEFDVRETLGAETWAKMNNAVQSALSNNSKTDSNTALAEARSYLDGHQNLVNEFDAIFNMVDNSTVALAADILAGSGA